MRLILYWYNKCIGDYVLDFVLASVLLAGWLLAVFAFAFAFFFLFVIPQLFGGVTWGLLITFPHYLFIVYHVFCTQSGALLSENMF